MSNLKRQRLNKLYGEQKIFRVLATDQRGALKRMLGKDTTDEQ